MDETKFEMVDKMEIEMMNRQRKNKLAEVEVLTENAKALVSKVKSEVAVSKSAIVEAANAFDKAKRTFNTTTFAKSETLLEKLGFEYITFEEKEAFELAIDGNAQRGFSVKSLSSGRFRAFLLAILVAFLTVSTWVYVALTKLKIEPESLHLETATSHIDPILNWIGGEMFSMEGDLMIGAFIVGFSGLMLGWLVYGFYVNLKGNKNLQIAQEAFEKSNAYSRRQEASKAEMQKVERHLREVTKEIGNFDIILNEQCSVLQRILHVEGAYDGQKAYHLSSKKVMRESEKLMRGIEHLLSTAITQEGNLNFQSVQALKRAREIYGDYLASIYD